MIGSEESDQIYKLLIVFSSERSASALQLRDFPLLSTSFIASLLLHDQPDQQLEATAVLGRALKGSYASARLDEELQRSTIYVKRKT